MVHKPGYIVSGEGVPVVLLHCSMSSKEQWLPLIDSLKKNFMTIAFDLYGYGSSPFPEDENDFHLEDEIAFFSETLDNLIGRDTKFHMVGHSYGGAVAMKYSSMSESRNISLCVYEPMLNHVSREIDMEIYRLGMEFIGDIEEDIKRGKPDLGCAKFIDFFSGEGTFRRLPEGIQELFKNCIAKMPLDYRATIDEKLSLDTYKNINIPVCLVAGNKSPDITLNISQKLSETLKNLEFYLINSGHMAPIERPDLVNPLIEKFIMGL